MIKTKCECKTILNNTSISFFTCKSCHKKLADKKKEKELIENGFLQKLKGSEKQKQYALSIIFSNYSRLKKEFLDFSLFPIESVYYINNKNNFQKKGMVMK
jgi:hypothetical protein